MAPTPYQYLERFARMAIERLNADSSLRTPAMLDFLLDSYASNNGATCDAQTRSSAHHICARRFAGTFGTAED